MKTVKRLVSVLLCLLLVIGTVPASVLADETTDAAEAERYRSGVFSRYDLYLEDYASDYTHLTDRSLYAYCAWADEIESYGAVRKSILWATHKLTGKELDTDAYADYLMKIMTMQEKGLLDTLAAQAAYTAKSSLLDNALNIGSATLSMLLDADAIKEISLGLKAAKSTVDFFALTEDTILNTQQALLLTYYSKSYEQKLSFLTAIRDNTDDAALKEAAGDLIQAAGLQFTYLVMNDADDLGKALGGVALQLGGFDDFNDTVNGVIEGAGQFLADRFDPDSKNFVDTIGKLSIKAGSLPQKTLRLFGLGASYFSAISAGFAIGGAIGAAFWGDDIEMFREMKAMNAIGIALSRGLNDYVSAANQGYDETAYENVRKVVAAGQALTYVRLRGEYCAVESIRGKDSAPDNLDDIYAATAANLTRYYNALAAIFPPQEGQVIVNACTVETENTMFTSSIVLPVVYLPGNEEVAEKINNSTVMQNFHDGNITYREENRATTAEYGSASGFTCFYDVYMDTVYSTAGALSMMFSELTYLGGNHPMHSYFGFTFDLETGEALTLNDLLNPDNANAKSALMELFIAELSKQISSDWAFQTPSEAINDVFSGVYHSQDGYNIWGFTDDGLTITFSPYMIASYVAGYFTVTVPYAELDGIIKSDYMPADRSGAKALGYPFLHKQGDDLSMYTCVYGEESEYAFTGDGTLYDIYVGKDNGSDTYVSMQGILFYANTMSISDLFWLPEAADDPVLVDFRTYTLNDADGTRSTIRLYASGNVEDVDLQE